MKKFTALILLLSLLATSTLFAAKKESLKVDSHLNIPIGYWLQTKDFKNIKDYGAPQSIIQIYKEKNGDLAGKPLTGISGDKAQPYPAEYCKQGNCNEYCKEHPKYCPLKNSKVLLPGMTFMYGLTLDGDSKLKEGKGPTYKNGKIFISSLKKSFDVSLQTLKNGELLHVDVSWMWVDRYQTWIRLSKSQAMQLTKAYSDCNKNLWNTQGLKNSDKKKEGLKSYQSCFKKANSLLNKMKF